MPFKNNLICIFFIFPSTVYHNLPNTITPLRVITFKLREYLSAQTSILLLCSNILFSHFMPQNIHFLQLSLQTIFYGQAALNLQSSLSPRLIHQSLHIFKATANLSILTITASENEQLFGFFKLTL